LYIRAYGNQLLYWSSEHDYAKVLEDAFEISNKRVQALVQRKLQAAEVARTDLDSGQYYPRIWRRGRYTWGDFGEDYTDHDIVLGIQAAELLLERMRDVFRTIQPCKANQHSFGHEIRALLLLACTEVESAWKSILRVNGYAGHPGAKGFWTTKDYVRLLRACLKSGRWLGARRVDELSGRPRRAHSPSPLGRGQGEGNRHTLTPSPLPRWGEGEASCPSVSHRGLEELLRHALRPLRLREWVMRMPLFPDYGEVAPFRSWKANDPTESLRWYAAYNAAKHDREGSFSTASLARVIEAVAAVFVMVAAQVGPPVLSEGAYSIREFVIARQPSWRLAEEYVPPFEFSQGKGARALPTWTPTNYPFR